MLFRKWLVSFVPVLVAVVVLTPQTASARGVDHHAIEPGQTKVFMCGWGYGPIAHEHALHADGERLKVRGVTRTSSDSLRVILAHKVTVREDGGGLYRTIINRGRRTVIYRNYCAGGGASY